MGIIVGELAKNTGIFIIAEIIFKRIKKNLSLENLFEKKYVSIFFICLQH